MHEDHRSYFKFTGPLRIEKAVNSLLGLVEGIAADNIINQKELLFLDRWIEEQDVWKDSHPFNELIPAVANAIADGILTEDEKLDILWLGRKLCDKSYFDAITTDMQRLQGFLGGIASDGIVTKDELDGLYKWLEQNEHLQTLWPYDEVRSLVTSILVDKCIDQEEHRILLNFFAEFVSILDDRTINKSLISTDSTLAGLCAVCPEIVFKNSLFCFTGASTKYTRSKFLSVVTNFGGSVSSSVSKKMNYLVIGGNGNPCWAYACYGRKVERAVELRKEGTPLIIMHENDFHDAVEDFI